MKKALWTLLILCLALGLCVPALASPGDAMIWHNTDYSQNIRSVLFSGRSVYCFMDGPEPTLTVFDMDTRESREYKLNPLLEGLPAELGVSAPEDSAESSVSGGFDFWFALDDQVYASLSVSTYEGSRCTIDGGYVRRLEMTEDGPKLVECDLPRLDYTDMVAEQEDGWQTLSYIRSAFTMDSRLFVMTNDDSSDILRIFDLKDGISQDRYLQNVSSFVPGPEGKLLASGYNFNDGSTFVSLYDPDADVTEELMTFAPKDGMTINPQNLCYRADNDTLYYTLDGEIWAAPSFDLSQAVSVNDSPVAYTYGVPAISSDGMLLIYDYQSIALRNLDPSVRGSVNLRVADYTYNSAAEQAYFEFTAKRGDISVILERSGDPSVLLQAMLNQDTANDVILLNVGTSQYNALFQRGFMADLSSSESLTALAGTLYPAVRNVVEKDGRLLALPVYAYGYGLGYDPIALEKMGLTEADLPQTWPEFLTFLNTLPAKAEGTRVVPVPPYYSRQDWKTTLFYTIIESYQNYLNSNPDANYTFNTPIMQETLDLLEKLDYEALGLPDQDEETEAWNSDWDDHGILFDPSTSTSMPTYGSTYKPLLLRFGEEKPVAGYEMCVAFVNPYSTHQSEAIAYLETLANCRETASVYTFSPENNEPKRHPNWEQYREEMEKEIQDLKDQLAKASEGEQTALQEMLEDREASLKDLIDNSWEVTPESIEAFRERADNVVPTTYDFYFIIMNTADASLTEMVQRFYQGECTSQELLEAIDSKYQMIRLEGE